MSESIDVTPTWNDVLPGLIAAANNGSQPAYEQLMLLAAVVDQGNADAVNIKERVLDVVEVAQTSATHYYDDGELDAYVMLVPGPEWNDLCKAVDRDTPEE